MIMIRHDEVLNAINKTFYEVHGHSFDLTRQTAWPGWEKLLPIFQKHKPKKIIDLGCGNGRFLGFLKDKYTSPFFYTGIDSNTYLLESAKKTYPKETFLVGDVTQKLELTESDYDAVVVFGLMHHLATKEQRKAFLSRVKRMLKPGGIAAVSWWQPDKMSGFDRKIVDIKSYNLTAKDRIDEFSWQKNDFLMVWQNDHTHPRFVHIFDRFEIEELINFSGLVITETFEADGRSGDMNIYTVVKKK